MVSTLLLLKALEDAGVSLVFTDLTQLPDSNRLYAAQVDFLSILIVRYCVATESIRCLWGF